MEKKYGILKNTGIDSKTITFENLPSGTYTVTATAVAPYSKTIKANFIITDGDEEITYKVSDAVNSPVLQLTILTKDYNGKLKVKWPDGVTPDNTNEIFEDTNTGYGQASKTINYSANSEYILQFFKQDVSKKYTDSDFSVERGN